MKYQHHDEMDAIIKAVIERYPQHGIVLIMCGENCGSHMVTNINPEARVPLFQEALAIALGTGGTLQ